MIKEKMKLVISNDDVHYYVTYDYDEKDIRYGIYAEVKTDEADCFRVEKIFFTEEEAAMRCRWLCENYVYPIAIYDVLRNII